MKRLPLGELELHIYNILKERHEVSVRYIVNSLNHSRKYTTILTIMTRMFKKGQLSRRKHNAHYLYSINETKEKELPPLLKQLKVKMFKNNSSAMISCLLDMDKSITDEELAQIEALIQKRKQDV